MRWASHTVLVLLLCLVAPRIAAAGLDPNLMSNGQVAAVVVKVSPAVVRVITVRPPKPEDANQAPQVAGAPAAAAAEQKTTTATGSGFIIDPAGFVATNRHVVEGGTSIFVMTADGERHQATIVGMPGAADMALLQIHAAHPFPTVAFGDSDKMQVGNAVIAIGSPFGFDTSVTAGIVSAVNRDIMESPFDDYIQTDAAINHGNSGGPLFNLQGEVIGMNSVIISPSTGSSGIGFALPSNEMRFVFSRIMKTGKVNAGMLPIYTQQVTWMLKQAFDAPDLQGALVTSVNDRGDMMMHGKIQPGDVVLTFNGDKVWDPRDLARKAAEAQIGSEATLGLCRGGVRLTAHVKIQAWPEAKPPTITDSGPKKLGLELVSADEQKGVPIVTVASVDPTGTAADSGIQKGDIIVKVQQTAVADPDQALRLFGQQASGKHHFAAVLVERDKKLSWMPLAIPD